MTTAMTENQTIEQEQETGAEGANAPETPSTQNAEGVPTREQLRSEGWSAEEMDKAEKLGLLPKAEKKPQAAKGKPAAPQTTEKGEEPEPEKPEEKTEAAKPQAKPQVGLPQFALSEEDEKRFTELFGPGTNVRGLFFRMKNERQARQALEERERQKDARIAELEAALKGKKPASPAEGEEGEEGAEADDRPLTRKELEAIFQERAAKEEQQRQELRQKRAKMLESAASQEEYAKSVYTDFEDTVKLAHDLIQNLDQLFPEKHQKAQVQSLVRDLQIAQARADQFELDDRHGPMIAYEIGRLHPKYGTAKPGPKTEKTDPPSGPKANGGLKPETVRRMEEVTQRRQSSASVSNGGGKRAVIAEEVTAADLLKMDSKQLVEFRTAYPERYAEILRG